MRPPGAAHSLLTSDVKTFLAVFQDSRFPLAKLFSFKMPVPQIPTTSSVHLWLGFGGGCFPPLVSLWSLPPPWALVIGPTTLGTG